MKMNDVITLFQYHRQSNLKPRPQDGYRFLLKRFGDFCGDRDFESIESDLVFQFLENLTRTHAKSTRRLRYAQMKAFYNFVIEKCAVNMKNPCNAPLVSKAFRSPEQVPRKILDKESVDEMIYNLKNPKGQAHYGATGPLRAENRGTLKIRASDISESKLLLREPKSGKDAEIAFMPEQVAQE